MYDFNETMVVYKVKQLGFDTKTVENVKKYFKNQLKEDDKNEVKELVTFIKEILVTSESV